MDWDIYKSVYCSVCRVAGNRFGWISRFILSYDCTFLAIMLLSVKKSCINFENKRCVFNPFKKCKFCVSDKDLFDFISGVMVILMYYKICDDFIDGSFLRKITSTFLKYIIYFPYKKAAKAFADVNLVVSRCMREQRSVEKKENVSVDKSCEQTAVMLSEIFSMRISDASTALVMKNMGYFMGRWVYLIDAADDILDDLAKGNFNPFSDKINNGNYSNANSNDLRLYINEVLNHSVSQIYNSYNLLECSSFKEILDNILKFGLSNVQKQVVFGKHKEMKA